MVLRFHPTSWYKTTPFYSSPFFLQEILEIPQKNLILHLHSKQTIFIHPHTSQLMHLDAPLPFHLKKSFGIFGFSIHAKEYDKELSENSKFSVASLGVWKKKGFLGEIILLDKFREKFGWIKTYDFFKM